MGSHIPLLANCLVLPTMVFCCSPKTEEIEVPESELLFIVHSLVEDERIEWINVEDDECDPLLKLMEDVCSSMETCLAWKDNSSLVKDASTTLKDASCASKTDERSLPEVKHAPKPSSHFILKFRTLSRQTLDVDFLNTRPPLGIKFLMDRVPAQVVEVQAHSVAELLGVGVGWKLLQVNNIDVQNHTLAELQVTMQEEMSRARLHNRK